MYFLINSLSADLTCATLHYVKAPSEFDIANEPSISYPDFCEVARMLPVLIGHHLNSPFKSEIVASFRKHYEGIVSAHDFQHNFAAYVCYDIMICQHWVNNSLDFNPAVFQPQIFSHCLEHVKAESNSALASRITSLEAQVTRSQSFCASTKPANATMSSASTSAFMPISEHPVTRATSKVIGICWFCAGKHFRRDCKSSSNSLITKHSNGKWRSSANELLCFLFNGVKGCSKNPCPFAHKCSIYGNRSAGHNAPP